MPLKIRNLEYIRQEIHPKLAEALEDLERGVNAAALQAGVDAKGKISPPPPIQKLHVTAANGAFSIALEDNGPLYRSVNYWLEWSLDPAWKSPRSIFLGPSRTHDIYLGNVTAHFRAYSEYPGSEEVSPHVYFNGNPVYAGGPMAPSMTPPTGAGTGSIQGGTGSGPVPFRSSVILQGQQPRLATIKP